MKEVQLEHPTPINQLSKQIHIRPSIVPALENSHLGKQHKSSLYFSSRTRVCVCVRQFVFCVCADWKWLHTGTESGPLWLWWRWEYCAITGGWREWEEGIEGGKKHSREESNETGREDVTSDTGRETAIVSDNCEPSFNDLPKYIVYFKESFPSFLTNRWTPEAALLSTLITFTHQSKHYVQGLSSFFKTSKIRVCNWSLRITKGWKEERKM